MSSHSEDVQKCSKGQVLTTHPENPGVLQCGNNRLPKSDHHLPVPVTVKILPSQRQKEQSETPENGADVDSLYIPTVDC
ncbi:MAG: hypothetical protein J6A01_08335 [Proteobacteria bacterium]|nr:hypothetical protein [Pseudomonadota bacterium]